MGGLKKIPSEGGSGGKRGHSAMEHWASTAEVKDAVTPKISAPDNTPLQLAALLRRGEPPVGGAAAERLIR
jgi:hypothetical protein